ncbi:hypothetical protein S7711_06115 [Stachybotrys chartarum IBT 7711]|uniref:Uncharacterized protein n=1 Tax=Stachybotrys chartarum (strain CBS 109288 / IBT 7711) TaxID=1280523 RepID=A0A084B662_STACB|nr:hypothetical protein S7711_06115 [Stachybotrys chartarum IBT 7711]KFA56467.1 hypothetical protein S40293_01141 [Stachybotrys chartarum IBT 40293]
MVCVTGAAVGAIATMPAAVAIFGQAGAAGAGGALIPAVAATQGITTFGAAVVAIGEGAVVGAGVIGGGSSSAGIALATFVGPIGWAVVGCNKKDNQNGDNGYTWDCWKPLVRDTSTRPSHGITLRCLAAHPNIRSMSLDQDGLLVGNVFSERFRLTPLRVEGMLAFHASIL